jgi:ABC-type multidrug transport system fused ATPase/permease subunit
MNGLENFFEKIIDKKRVKELYHYNHIMKQGIANVFLFHNIGVFMTIVLLIYSRIQIMKNNSSSNLIQAEIIITIILMLNKLNYPLYRFPVFATGLIDSYVSGKRIIEFLNMKQTSKEFYDNLDVENLKNKNICILGPNGGGKTTFIKYLMKKIKNSKMSYCSQEKFIMDNTIRENILFGNKFEKEKYLSVINDCQLTDDINNFKEKDMKECKINGIQLSGGQKSRVDLARAIYNDSDYYFFDDIFVSYDNKIRVLIFNKVFLNKIRNSNRNIISSFSNINFLDKNNLNIFNYFIFIENKQIIFQGDYNTFINSEFYSSSIKNNIINSNVEEKLNKDIVNKNQEKKQENKKFFESKIKITMKEIGCYFCFGLVFYQVVYQILELKKTKYILYNFKNLDINKISILDTYLILCVINIFFEFMITSTQYNATYYLNEKLTRKILSKIILTPLFSFLQLSKSSDIINRLSKDIEKIRYPLKFVQFVLRDIFGFLIISIIIIRFSKIVILSLILNIFLSFILFIYFIDKGKLYNNLERDSHSPLINLFTESLKGNLYIQVYQKENYFKNLLYKIMDKILKINIFKFGSISMFQMYHEIICNINFFVLLYLFMNEFIINNINKEEFSILLTFSLNLNESVCKLYRSLLDLSLNKIYFDRLLQYENIEQEVNCLNKASIPFSYGDIKFENVCMRYNKNSELILKNININIKNGEKVAIIGRTGSGKSSIILCLLRIIQNFELISGNISINGININDFNLKELRKNISVISQKPFIFNDCSIKENIDPEGFIKENRLLLNKIKEFKFMEKFVNKYINKEKDLDKNITDLTLSEGEKQIICLCRIMINNNKIIIMDEATSNIDLDTEKLIYDDFINNISKDTTIISILHKLDYIKYYNRVIELSDNGSIKL